MSCLFPGKRIVERAWKVLFCEIEFHPKDSFESEGLSLVHLVLGMERKIPASFFWHYLSAEWEFVLCFGDISMMEIMSAWLEVRIRMILGKCYMTINEKHIESLPL